MLAGDCRQQPEGAVHDGWQPCPRALDLLGERALRARQRVVREERPRERRLPHVYQQAVGGDRRLELQRGLGKGRATLVIAGEHVPQRDAQQAQHARPRRCRGRLRGIEQRERHGIAVVDQGRVPGEALAAASERQCFRQVAKIPLAQPLPFESRIHRRKRELRGIAQLGSQCRQVAPS